MSKETNKLIFDLQDLLKEANSFKDIQKQNIQQQQQSKILTQQQNSKNITIPEVQLSDSFQNRTLQNTIKIQEPVVQQERQYQFREDNVKLIPTSQFQKSKVHLQKSGFVQKQETKPQEEIAQEAVQKGAFVHQMNLKIQQQQQKIEEQANQIQQYENSNSQLKEQLKQKQIEIENEQNNSEAVKNKYEQLKERYQELKQEKTADIKKDSDKTQYKEKLNQAKVLNAEILQQLDLSEKQNDSLRSNLNTVTKKYQQLISDLNIKINTQFEEDNLLKVTIQEQSAQINELQLQIQQLIKENTQYQVFVEKQQQNLQLKVNNLKTQLTQTDPIQNELTQVYPPLDFTPFVPVQKKCFQETQTDSSIFAQIPNQTQTTNQICFKDTQTDFDPKTEFKNKKLQTIPLPEPEDFTPKINQFNAKIHELEQQIEQKTDLVNNIVNENENYKNHITEILREKQITFQENEKMEQKLRKTDEILKNVTAVIEKLQNEKKTLEDEKKVLQIKVQKFEQIQEVFRM
ncbi:Hypothetical_protein [Hexamita inflata]|uniref:Hypothetical_protein n=1 Tax=Hexamita inflata TaxID=28002 RepID=A0AA86NRB4_9EUKA|nr:Hypothetical protein HINF_LOCUS12672 [Hexamita inflata]